MKKTTIIIGIILLALIGYEIYFVNQTNKDMITIKIALTTQDVAWQVLLGNLDEKTRGQFIETVNAKVTKK